MSDRCYYLPFAEPSIELQSGRHNTIIIDPPCSAKHQITIPTNESAGPSLAETPLVSVHNHSTNLSQSNSSLSQHFHSDTVRLIGISSMNDPIIVLHCSLVIATESRRPTNCSHGHRACIGIGLCCMEPFMKRGSLHTE